MASFFKTFGLGVIYVITLPFILMFWAIYAIYCLGVFIYMAIRNVIIFFSGGTPNGDMKEDVEAKRILLERSQKSQASQNIYVSPQPVLNEPTPMPEPVQNEPEPYEQPAQPENMFYPDEEELPIDNSFDGDNKDGYVD